MKPTDPELPRWWKAERHADLAAAVVLLALCAGAAGLTWGRLDNPIGDVGWDMQVAERVLSGDVLYRDVIWMYGPLPVYLLSFLFGWLGVHVTSYMLLLHLLGATGALLTYRVARSLLPPGLALGGTAAVLAGGIWGGYLAYALPYTGAIPLGAVFGLAFLACLLSYLGGGGAGWLIAAGAATGAALLTKPEFALATLGTGLVILAAACLHPHSSGRGRRSNLGGLAIYVLSLVAVAGIAYGLLGSRAGWPELWAGISGYDEDAILLRYWPPWGSPLAWGYLLSGCGLWLSAAAFLVAVAVPGLRRRRLAATAAMALGLLLALLPGRLPGLPGPRLFSAAMRGSVTSFVETLMPTWWAPATSLLMAWGVVLARRWWVSRRLGEPMGAAERQLGTLVLYSALANARSFLNPAATFHFLFLGTCAPVLIYTAHHLATRLAAKRAPGTRPARVSAAVTILLGLYAMVGLSWDAAYLAQFQGVLDSRRGTVMYPLNAVRRSAWAPLQEYLLSHTAPGDSIAVLGHEPGFYFLNALRNPLRQDTILPGMGASPRDAEEIVVRLTAAPPRLIVVPQSVERGGGWFWDLPEGREAYAALAPVWAWVAEHYRLQRVVGAEPWGYVIFERPDLAGQRPD